MSADAVRGISAAADLFESALRELGTSQSGLVRAFEPPEEAELGLGGGAGLGIGAGVGLGMEGFQGADPVESRRRLFEAAADSLGRMMDTRAIVMMVRPKPGEQAKVEVFGGHGVIGYRARTDVMPLVLGRSVDPSQGDSLAPAQRGRLPGPPQLSGERVLMDFCTRPLALVSHRRHAREVHAVVEPRGTDESVDVVLASNGPDDDENSQHLRRVQETRFNIRVPTREAVFDVYLDRTLAQNCVPSLDLYLWPREAKSFRPANWYDALPGAPLLAVLGSGTRNAASTAYSRHAELTEALFAASGWSAEQFVGFRCQVPYPFWASCYVMSFDYRSEVESE